MKYVILLLIYFGLHCAESYPPIGGLSIAQLWKLPLLAYLIFYALRVPGGKEPFVKHSWWIAIESLFNIELIKSTLYSVVQSTKNLPLALFYVFFTRQFTRASLEKYLYIVCEFVCISSIPFLLGLMQLQTSTYDLEETYGEGAALYAACFGNSHAAASYFCAAILVLGFGIVKGKIYGNFHRKFVYFLIFIALLSLYKTFVRTGWIMLVIGLFAIIPLKQLKSKHIIAIIMAGLVGISAYVYEYNNNDTFRYRITGSTMYSENTEGSIARSSSGRTYFWWNGVDLWFNNSSPIEFLFGHGLTEVMDNNAKKTGMRVFSHSQFVDQLAQHGLLGFLLLFFFYRAIYRFVKLRQYDEYYKLNIALLSCAVVFSIFQSELYFDYTLIFGLALSIQSTSDAINFA